MMMDHVKRIAILERGEALQEARAKKKLSGSKCSCDQPHYTPLWWCEEHGDVVVPMD